MKSVRKAVACTLCAIFTVGVVGVSAKWVEAGYDTSAPENYGKIYNEVLGGVSTSNHKVIPVAEKDVVWKAESFESAYPHAGYDRLYLEGNWQNITKYNDTFAQWEVRNKDYMWEMTYPYEIYQRQQTNIPGEGWTWDYYPQDDGKVFSKTNRCANVKVDYRNYGIADLTLDGIRINEYVKEMYSKLITTKIEPLENRSLLSIDSLSAKKDNGEYIVSDADIQANIEIISTKFLTGPALASPAVKDVANAYLNNMYAGWKWDPDIIKVEYNGKIGWTEDQFEMEEPYYNYQFLIVNGMVMDGRNETPRIVRLTGGKATPNVTWKYVFAEKDYPYNVVEGKFINGVPAKDLDGQPIYRIATGEFANSTIKVTSTDIEVWIKDSRGGLYKISSTPKYLGVLGDDASGIATGNVLIP